MQPSSGVRPCKARLIFAADGPEARRSLLQMLSQPKCKRALLSFLCAHGQASLHPTSSLESKENSRTGS